MPSEVPLRKVLTYAEGPVNADPYYQENLVLSDLPAGLYKISIRIQRQKTAILGGYLSRSGDVLHIHG